MTPQYDKCNGQVCTSPYLTRYTRGDARIFFCYTYKTYLYAQNEISYEYIQLLFANCIKLHEFANCNSANYNV